MNSDTHVYAVPIARHPVFSFLVSFPIACFTGALATDLAYAGTANMMWADFSAWLLFGGMVTGVIAAVVGLFGLVTTRRMQRPRPVLPLVLGGLIVLVLAMFDNLVHSRDAWTSVVPLGLGLSALTVVAMLITAWLGAPRFLRADSDMIYEGVHS